MATKLTKPHQITLLKDGLAIGCAANGVTALRTSWQSLGQALERALRDWSYRDTFAQVKAHPQSDIRNILETSPTDRAYGGWAWRDGWCCYSTKNNETIDDIADLISNEIPTEAWATFARLFLAKFDESEVQRG